MKIRQASGVLAFVLLLAGCKNFWQASSSSGGGCGTKCSTISSGVFYVLNSTTGNTGIAGYSIVSGKLVALSGSPYSLPSGPHAIAVAPNNRFLYVSSQSGIYLYTIGADGVLTLASTTPVFTDFAAYSMQVDLTNSWLVEASGYGYLSAIPISPTTGMKAGSAQQVSLVGITPRQMVLSPDNLNVIVALGNSGTEVVPFNAASTNPLPASAAALIAVKNAAGSADSVAVDPANRLLYIGETAGTSGTAATGILRAFLYGSIGGTPVEATGSPYASGGLAPVSILPTASGANVYVANSTGSSTIAGNIAAFAVTVAGSAYSLTALTGQVATGISPSGLAQDSTGSVVLLVNSGGSPDLDVYTFDTASPGMLDSTFTFATGTDPVGALAIAAAP
jgi:6-phosphogluconolactonase (cycloisomerase 2 family)